MKKNIFCLLLTSVVTLSACGGFNNSQSGNSSENGSILDDSVSIECSASVEDDFSSTESSEADGSSADEGFRSEKIADEAAWNEATGDSLPNNFSFEGRAWYDDVVADMKLSFETSTKARISLSRTDRPEYVEGGVLEQNGELYSYYEWSETPITDLSNAEWEEGDMCGVTNFNYYAKIPFMCYYYEDFSYEEESGVYITEDGNVEVWFLNGKVVKIECEKIELKDYDGELVPYIHYGTFIFGETVVEFETYPDIEAKDEKVVDEAIWNAAIEKSFQNYTFTGRVWYDNTICDAVIRIEDTKGRCSLSAIQETVLGTLISGFMETGGIEIDGIVYGYEKISDVPIDDLTDVIWEISDYPEKWHINYWFEGYYKVIISELCKYSNFTYDKNVGAYIYNEEECVIKIWFKNGKVKKLECENVGFTETDGGQVLVHWATIEFGGTAVEFETYPNVD